MSTSKSGKIDPCHTPYPLIVRKSRVDRWGVFTLGTIPTGRRVIEYSGQRLTHRQARLRFLQASQQARSNRIYLARLDKRWVIDGAVGGTGAELINHSCDPNIAMRRIRGHILYFSRRTIRRGEELTVDYRISSSAPKVACRCGSKKCRGTLNVLSSR
jgi:uncharacterized protein